MVMQHVNFFRNLDSVVRELDRRGHEVVLLHGTRLDDAKKKARLVRKKNGMPIGRGIEVATSEIPAISVGFRPEPKEPWHRRLLIGRQVVNWSVYLRKGHPSPHRVTGVYEKRLSQRVKRFVQSRLGHAVLSRPFSLRVWRWVERLTPPSPTVLKVLRNVRPHVVVVSPMVWPKDPVEADYVRAARSLGIPTVGYLNSWDNLTSKGTVHVVPDVFVVWNKALADEAVEIHRIPRKAIRITGAPQLDWFFEMRPTRTLTDICQQMGCPNDRPYVVYLCSSRTLIASEVDVVTVLADALARQFTGDPPTLVVRPHPVNAQPWEGYGHPGVVIYPQRGDQADSPQSWQEYYNQLSRASCVIGLNTTAFLEAVVADRPCLTIVADEFDAAQGRTGHFRHLIGADFLEVSSTPAEVAIRVAKILAGADEKAVGRHAFAEWFLRPGGLASPVTPRVADLFERLAGRGVSTSLLRPAHSDRQPALAAAEDR